MKPGSAAETEVLDASALLAYLYREAGQEQAAEALVRGAIISSVNLAEVHSTLTIDGVPSDEVVARLLVTGLDVEPFGAADAAVVGRLQPLTRSLGLSLADRACLALAIRLGRSVLTADRDLASADVGVDVHLIR